MSVEVILLSQPGTNINPHYLLKFIVIVVKFLSLLAGKRESAKIHSWAISGVKMPYVLVKYEIFYFLFRLNLDFDI